MTVLMRQLMRKCTTNLDCGLPESKVGVIMGRKKGTPMCYQKGLGNKKKGPLCDCDNGIRSDFVSLQLSRLMEVESVVAVLNSMAPCFTLSWCCQD